MLTVRLNTQQLISVWKAVRTMIRSGASTTPQDHAFLMETMSDLAKFQNKTEVLLPRQKWTACWHALNVVINNKLAPDTEMGVLCEALSFIAIVLDNPNPMDVPPEKHLKLV